MKMKITNMESPNGNAVPNQFIITDEYGNKYFQSYQSIIVKIDKDRRVFLDEYYWNYSMTTGKYRNQFLHETKKETERKIKSGEYILADLN